MARRVNSELLLVGSLPADSAQAALRSAAGLFGDLVFALPDGDRPGFSQGRVTCGSAAA